MFPMFGASLDTAAVGNILVAVIGSYTLDALLDGEQRRQHKEQCAERLAAQDNVEVQYAEQAVLANLDWGIDALEEAILTSNTETKTARLEHAEKMLQVCALLDVRQTTAGVPNSYLSAWARLNLAFVWKLRNNDRNTAAHMLEMFLVEPLYSRVDFAPGLWEHLFLPHLTSIVSWYTEQRHQILSSVLPEGSDFSFSREDLIYNDGAYQSLLSNVSAEQAAQLQQLEKLYQDSLDEKTRLYARYYKDWLNFDPSVSIKKSMPLMPIAEPPMTPLHELTRIPESVKFGPQPPKSAGFSQSAYGLGMGFGDNGRSPPMYEGVTKRLEDPLKSRQGSYNSMWEETEETEELKRGAAGRSYGVDMETTPEWHLKKHSSDYSNNAQFTKVQKEGLYRSNGLRSRDSSPNDQLSSSYETQTAAKQRSKPAAHESVRSTRKRTGRSKPLMELFRDPGAIMVSSPLSTSTLEESYSSIESELEEEVQPNCRSSGSEAVTNLGETYDFVKDEEEGPTDEEAEEVEDLEAESNFRSPSPPHGETSSALLDGEENPGESMFVVKLPEKSAVVTRPPKDFVCPITSQIFNDPVTLETGQTYEHRAIREWLDRGNTTCPITRQTLRSTSLPKTNYVLKRVIASWKERHPELALEFGSVDSSPRPATPSSASGSSIPLDQTMPGAGSPDSLRSSLSSESPNSAKGRLTQRFNRRGSILSSPTSVISQAFLESLISELKPAVACLCDSDELQECEAAVLTVARIWQDSKGDGSIQAHLNKSSVIKGFLEVLSTTVTGDALRASLFILSELIIRDEGVAQIMVNEDPELEYLVILLKRGIMGAAVILYQLRAASSQLAFLDLLPSLVNVLRQSEEGNMAREGSFQMCMNPKESAVLMIDQMLKNGDENTKYMNAHSIISMEGLSPLVDSLESSNLEERMSAVSILLCCMQADGSCRIYIAQRGQLAPVLELLHSGSERARMVTISFLSELVRTNRRSINNQILQVIKEEGALSTVHIVLVHLQMTPLEQRPIVAGFLLQLDLLTEPRKRSMYREEAVEALVETLANQDALLSQVAAAETIVALGGRFSLSGNSLMEAWLLKSAGLDQNFNALSRTKQQIETASSKELEEEEQAAKEWEKRVAGALINYEHGAILEALGKCVKSGTVDLSRPCMIAASWLVHMLPLLPDTGVLETARRTLMPSFIRILKSSKDVEEKVLAVLALHSFIDDPEGVVELVSCVRDLSGPLRQLKRSTWMAKGILRVLISSPSVNAPEIWTHEELGPPIDASMHGEVRSLAHCRGRLFSGHADGSLKVWDGKKDTLSLMQDIKEHSRSVTCLSISSSGDRLYSGSLDRTVMAWVIGQEQIHFLKALDMKDPVQSLSANCTMFCFAPQGAGVKVYNLDAGSNKQLIGNKHVQTIAMADGKLFCGCTDNSIQELDLAGGNPAVFQQGVRTLLGKKPIYALQVFNGMLYAAGSPIDGVAAKVWNLLDKSIVGVLPTSLDVRAMAVNEEFIYLGSSSGLIEVWLRERLVKVTTLPVGSKVTSLVATGDLLHCGSEDGKIRSWALV